MSSKWMKFFDVWLMVGLGMFLGLALMVLGDHINILEILS